MKPTRLARPDGLAPRGCKSIRECGMGPRKLNVAVGPNGAGEPIPPGFFPMMWRLVEDGLQDRAAGQGGPGAPPHCGGAEEDGLEGLSARERAAENGGEDVEKDAGDAETLTAAAPGGWRRGISIPGWPTAGPGRTAVRSPRSGTGAGAASVATASGSISRAKFTTTGACARTRTILPRACIPLWQNRVRFVLKLVLEGRWYEH